MKNLDPVKLSIEDEKKLRNAVYLLDTIPITIKLANYVGKSIEGLLDKVPTDVQEKITSIAENALKSIVDTTVDMMDDDKSEASPKLHKILAGAAGAIGGFFGFSAVLAELPISTTIMMRSIIDIARGEGFSIQDPETKMECISVFGLTGNSSNKDDNSESGYYASRAALGKIISVATTKLADEGIKNGVNKFTAEQATNMLVKLIQKIAQQFGIVLSEKAALQSIPIIGAVSGAVINTMFTDFYQDMAKGHFTVLALEKKYNKEIIKREYNKISIELKKSLSKE